MAAADEQLPGWALEAEEAEATRVQANWPHPVTREWAWGGSRGEGVRVCVIDSGVDSQDPVAETSRAPSSNRRSRWRTTRP
jgi:hypothetical protein